MAGPKPRPVEERFWEKVDKDGPIRPGMQDPCWEWSGAKWSGGQGVFYVSAAKRTNGAHRFIWEQLHGALQEGEFVCQRCENLSCVRPDHLYIGDERAAHRSAGRSGAANAMSGRKHTATTRQKMSKARTGKTGANATAWKGGRLTINRQVRHALHRQFGWYAAVLRRDRWTCRACGKTAPVIDAHHIKPLGGLIERLLQGQPFTSMEEAVAWLLQQPEIVDSNHDNGLTLCRPCHKDVHRHWGSHVRP